MRKHSNLRLSYGCCMMLVLFCSLLFLSGCWGNDGQQETQENEELSNDQIIGGNGVQEPAVGGVLNVGLVFPPGEVLNPIFSTTTDQHDVLGLIYESLLRLNDEYEWEPWLAQEWEYEEESNTLIVHLREDIQWHDGQTFTAEDVRFTYEVLAHPDYNGLYSSYVRSLKGYAEYQSEEQDSFNGVEVLDSSTVVFHFEEKEPSFLAIASIKIIPAHIFDRYHVQDMADSSHSKQFDQLIGTGPFIADYYADHQYYELHRNESYWLGAPFIESMNWILVNPDVAFRLLQTGDLDLMIPSISLDLSSVETFRNREGLNVWIQPSFTYVYLGYKMAYRPEDDIEGNVVDPEQFEEHDRLSDYEFRQTIQLALHDQQLIEQLPEGLMQSVVTPAPHPDWLEVEEQYDVDQVESIFTELAFIDRNNDGYRQWEEDESFHLTLLYDESISLHQTMADSVQRDLQTVGLRIESEAVPSDEYAERLLRDDPTIDLFLGQMHMSPYDPNPLSFWEEDHIWNFMRWSNDEHEQLLLEVKNSYSVHEQGEVHTKYRAWSEYVKQERPYALILHKKDYLVFHDRLQGIKQHPIYMGANIHEWYLHTEEVEENEING